VSADGCLLTLAKKLSTLDPNIFLEVSYLVLHDLTALIFKLIDVFLISLCASINFSFDPNVLATSKSNDYFMSSGGSMKLLLLYSLLFLKTTLSLVTVLTTILTLHPLKRSLISHSMNFPLVKECRK
jgi:hypothetical protein